MAPSVWFSNPPQPPLVKGVLADGSNLSLRSRPDSDGAIRLVFQSPQPPLEKGEMLVGVV